MDKSERQTSVCRESTGIEGPAGELYMSVYNEGYPDGTDRNVCPTVGVIDVLVDSTGSRPPLTDHTTPTASLESHEAGCFRGA